MDHWMANKMLVPNKGKKGSYTIKVPKDYAVPKKPLLELIEDFYESEKRLVHPAKDGPWHYAHQGGIAMLNHWIITKTYVGSGTGLPVRIFSEGFPMNRPLNKGCKHQFRMYDGDRNLYFEGVADFEGFDPLDDYGTAYGCTAIFFKNSNRVWEEL